MKKKSILKKFIVLLTLLTPTIINAKEYIVCGADKKFPTVIGTMVSTIYIIIRIIVPLLLVFSGLISFLKVTVSGNVDDSLDKAKKKFITNIITAVIIFFIVSIVNFIINISVGTESELKNCVYCLIHPEKCEQIDSDFATLCPGLISEQYKYDSNCNLKDEYKDEEKIDYANTGDTGVPAYTNTIASAGGSTIARTITDNPNALTNQNIITKSDVESGYSYYIYVPKKIDGNKPALIVYLHGNGRECGYGYNLMATGFGFAKYIEKGMEFNAYILMPQKHDRSGWNTSAVTKIMNREIENLGIDKDRISIWGYSAGAEAVPGMVNINPNTFSSAVILARGGNPSYVSLTGFDKISTYGFYGTADGYANTNTPGLINRLKIAGYKAYIKAYQGVDHDHVMEKLMVDQDIGNGFTNIMDWVLSQRRSN